MPSGPYAQAPSAPHPQMPSGAYPQGYDPRVSSIRRLPSGPYVPVMVGSGIPSGPYAQHGHHDGAATTPPGSRSAPRAWIPGLADRAPRARRPPRRRDRHHPRRRRHHAHAGARIQRAAPGRRRGEHGRRDRGGRLPSSSCSAPSASPRRGARSRALVGAPPSATRHRRRDRALRLPPVPARRAHRERGACPPPSRRHDQPRRPRVPHPGGVYRCRRPSATATTHQHLQAPSPRDPEPIRVMPSRSTCSCALRASLATAWPSRCPPSWPSRRPPSPQPKNAAREGRPAAQRRQAHLLTTAPPPIRPRQLRGGHQGSAGEGVRDLPRSPSSSRASPTPGSGSATPARPATPSPAGSRALPRPKSASCSTPASAT